MHLFIVSNRDRTYYFANNNARHFAFNADNLETALVCPLAQRNSAW